MKAKGTAQDADALHVYVECMREPEVGLVELITPKVGVILYTRGVFCFNLHPTRLAK